MDPMMAADNTSMLCANHSCEHSVTVTVTVTGTQELWFSCRFHFKNPALSSVATQDSARTSKTIYIYMIMWKTRHLMRRKAIESCRKHHHWMLFTSSSLLPVLDQCTLSPAGQGEEGVSGAGVQCSMTTISASNNIHNECCSSTCSALNFWK